MDQIELTRFSGSGERARQFVAAIGARRKLTAKARG
jgi:hypothetical protein